MIRSLETECCIAGGGPAGLMLGYLLARAGVDVVVLEEHADFLRDFRGDTIHPSTLEVMHELGLITEFRKLPHEPVSHLFAQFDNERLEIADFSHLPVHAPFIAMMPQWDFLNFLAEKAAAFANFRLLMECEATGLRRDGSRVVGVDARCPQGAVAIDAKLVVAADGRGSRLRAAAGLAVEDFGAPMDVLWFRLGRNTDDTDETLARFFAGGVFIMLNRGDYWQCAYVIPKGSNERVRAAGLPLFRNSLRRLLPIDPARADEIGDWQEVKLLSVQVNRLTTWWQPGFLCIGDAAHAMSPIAGVGINLAVQDAIATANRLARPLRTGTLADDDLAAVQRRRNWPTRVTQSLQLTLQKRVIAAALGGSGTVRPPLLLKLLLTIPGFKRLPARLIGLGIRPEHVAADILSGPE